MFEKLYLNCIIYRHSIRKKYIDIDILIKTNVILIVV